MVLHRHGGLVDNHFNLALSRVRFLTHLYHLARQYHSISTITVVAMRDEEKKVFIGGRALRVVVFLPLFFVHVRLIVSKQL